MGNNKEFYNKVEGILHDVYGSSATFRKGQYEAIESVYNNPRTLVVQKTGWGKSLVYFISTKLFRSEGKGLTIVISPLLVLMENQEEAAVKLGLKCASLNSSKKCNREEVIDDAVNDRLDILFTTPEALFKADFQMALKNIRIGLFVIDEAHCISDWGHDFRLEYGKLNKIIKTLPSSVHLLGTTATANNRVIKDLEKQLGNNVFISRGDLTRESLHISVVRIKNTAERYAWILKNLDNLPGVGIIYCLTQRDCDYLNSFLQKNGISSMSYYSRGPELEELNEEAIEKFSNNELKVLVSTIKLGMGFDKGDIGFIIHYQMPSNIVSYYQQIGRAGRNIDKAYAILMCGDNDIDITNYFIESAFPSEKEANSILGVIKDNTGCKISFINSKVNFRKSRIDKAIDFLINEEAIYKEKSLYYPSLNKYVYKKDDYEAITRVRKQEQEQMYGILSTKKCLSNYIINALDDKSNIPCKHCSNCTNLNDMFTKPTMDEIDNALLFINNLEMDIEPRKVWPNYKRIPNVLEYGICLSKYNDVGYGRYVKEDKYSTGIFREELIKKSASVLKPFISKNNIKLIVL